MTARVDCHCIKLYLLYSMLKALYVKFNVFSYTICKVGKNQFQVMTTMNQQSIATKNIGSTTLSMISIRYMCNCCNVYMLRN